MSEQAQTFPCPACGEFISGRAERCRFCDGPVDPAAARAAADLQGRVNRACSDANFLRVAATSMWFALALWAGLVSVLLNSIFLVMLGLLPFLIARWQWRFGRLQSADRDFARARRDKNLSLLLWLAALAAAFVLLRLPSDYDLLRR